MALCDHFTVAGAGHLLQFRPVTSVGRKLSSYLLHSNHWQAMQRYLTFRCWLQKHYKQHMDSKFQSEHTQGGSGLSAAFCPVVVYNMYSLKSFGSMSAHWLRGWSLGKKICSRNLHSSIHYILCICDTILVQAGHRHLHVHVDYPQTLYKELTIYVFTYY